MSYRQYSDNIKGKLEAEQIDLQDYTRAIDCLNKCVAPRLCVVVYKRYIYKKGV